MASPASWVVLVCAGVMVIPPPDARKSWVYAPDSELLELALFPSLVSLLVSVELNNDAIACHILFTFF